MKSIDRRTFMGILATGGAAVTGVGMSTLTNLGNILSQKKSQKMPVLFIGHGSPMNAIAENNFTRTLNALGKRLPTPEAILCISAHWMTEGSWITRMDRPKTIHDFYGFPQPLFDVQYPASGRPDIADGIIQTIQGPKIHPDSEAWGLDHGTWSILKHMYPEANVPVIQLSLYLQQAPEYHIKLGQELAKLRERGIMIVSSGNIVHNLRTIRWEENAKAYDWAIEFDQWSKSMLEKRDLKALSKDFLSSQSGKLSVPSMDHYYPLLYTLGASDAKDELKFEYEEIQNGSISMRAVSFGA